MSKIVKSVVINGVKIESGIISVSSSFICKCHISGFESEKQPRAFVAEFFIDDERIKQLGIDPEKAAIYNHFAENECWTYKLPCSDVVVEEIIYTY